MLKKIMSAIDEADEGTVLSLCAAFVIAIGMRLMTYRSVFVGSDVVLIGADPYYHLRRVIYIVEHFPHSMPFDPFINYPDGLWVGWPPLYDQMTALFAIVVGLGNPDPRTISVVCAYFPVIIAAFTVVLVFLITKRIFDDNATGLAAAFMFAIMPAHVTRSVLGFGDHDAAMTFISTLIFLMFLAALRYASRSKDRGSGIISDRTTLAASIMFGISMAVGMYTWLGAPIFIAIVAVYAFIQWVIDCRYRPNNTKNSMSLISVCLVGSFTALLLMLPVMGAQFGMVFTMNQLSLFHTTFAGLFFMFWLIVWLITYILDKKQFWQSQWYIKPISVILAYIIVLAILFIVVPDFYQAGSVAAGFMTKQTTVISTIQETTSIFYMGGVLSPDYIIGFFSTSFIAFIAGLFILSKRYIREHGNRMAGNTAASDRLLFLLVWSLYTLALSALQIRFTNFFAVNVAILSGYTITVVVYYMQNIRTKRPAQKTIMQILAGLVVLGIVIPTASAALALTDNPLTPAKTDWYVSLQWLEGNTPSVSEENPEYGVLSWWSFGNWIVQVGDRPVVANNFQTGVDKAAIFFTTSDIAKAEQILKDNKVRYIITDYYMGYSVQNGNVYGKFDDMKRISGSHEIYYTYNYDDNGGFSVIFTPQYYNTMFSRLALDEGRGLDNFTLVYRSPRTTTESGNTVSQIMIFEYLPFEYLPLKP